MTMNTVKTEDGNVSCETPEGTVVHININQRSAFDCLLDTFRFFLDMKKTDQKTEPSHGSAAPLGLGVAYISLGLFSVLLAIIIAVVQPEFFIFYSGLHFWVGFPFILSGAVNLVSCKYPNKYWMALAFISILGTFGVSIAGIVITSCDVYRLRWLTSDEVCSNLWHGRKKYYEPTRAQRYDEFNSDLQRCKINLQRYKYLQGGLIILTLLMMIWGVCLTILSVVCRVSSWWRFCTQQLSMMEVKAHQPHMDAPLLENAKESAGVNEIKALDAGREDIGTFFSQCNLEDTIKAFSTRALEKRIQTLAQKEIRLFWTNKTLQSYRDCGRSPRGLRTFKEAPQYQEDSDFMQQWKNAHIEHSLKLLRIVLDRSMKEYDVVKGELDKMWEELRKRLTEAQYASFHKKLEIKLVPMQNEIKERQKDEFLRDKLDFDKDQIFTWNNNNSRQKPRKYGRFREQNNSTTDSSPMEESISKAETVQNETDSVVTAPPSGTEETVRKRNPSTARGKD